MSQPFDRDDAKAGRCRPNQVNCETFKGHQERLARYRVRPLTKEEAIEAKFKPEQIEEYFGNADNE